MAEALFQIAEPGESRGKDACRTRAVGIDLGTTNSLVAIVDAADSRPALRDERRRSDRAVGGALRGRRAAWWSARTRAIVWRPSSRATPSPRSSASWAAGRRDAEATRKLTPYQLRRPTVAVDDGVVRFAVAGARAVTPMEVSAEILRVLRARAEEALGGAARRAR